MSDLNHYTLSRNFWDFAFDNPEKISPNHCAIYYFAIEHCNRLGWKEKFGFPSQMTMDAVGIKKHSTYKRYFDDLVDWGFFELIQQSKNQYSANIIRLTSAIPKNGEALGKAIAKHGAKQTESIGQSNGLGNGQSKRSINKPLNNEPINLLTKELLTEVDTSSIPLNEFEHYEIALNIQKKIRETILESGGSTKKIDQANYKTWVDPIRLMMTTDGITRAQINKAARFGLTDDFWKKNILSTANFRKHFDKLILESNGKQKNGTITERFSKEYLDKLAADISGM